MFWRFVITLLIVFPIQACATVATANEPTTVAHESFPDFPPLGTVVEFHARDFNHVDQPMYISDMHGEGLPLVLEFYFQACPACNTNAPNVRQLANEFHGDTAHVIEVSIDEDAADYRDWLAMHPADFPVLNGGDRELVDRLGIRSYPTTIVLNAQHEIVFRHVGVWTSSVKSRIREFLQAFVMATRH